MAEGINEALIQKGSEGISFLRCETSVLLLSLRPEYVDLIMSNIKITTKNQGLLFLRFEAPQIHLEVTIPFVYSIT